MYSSQYEEASKGSGGGFLAKLRAHLTFVAENLEETKSTWWRIFFNNFHMRRGRHGIKDSGI